MKWAEELEHASTTGLARCFGGAFLGALERNVEQVAEHAYKSVELAKTLEMPLWLGWSRVFLGWALALRGDLDTGSSEIEQGILELRNNRCAMLMPILLGLSAEANAAAGKLELAHGDIDDGFDVLEKSHYVAWKSHLHLVRGELHLLGSVPNLEQAQKQFATAVDLARAQQIRMIELRAATRLASVRAVTGNADKAVETLSALYGSFTEGFDTPDLKSTKKLLDQLS